MKFTKFTPSAAVTTKEWSTLPSKFYDKNQYNVALRVLNSNKIKVSTDLSKSRELLTLVFSFFTFSNKFSHVWKTLKTEVVCCLSRWTLSVFVKNSAKNPTSVQNERSPIVTLKVYIILTWMWNLFWYLFKLYFDSMF